MLIAEMARLETETKQAKVLSSTADADSESTVYLTLGDGDFTYSLDLARYMKLSSASQSSSSTKQQKRVKLILTGVDTIEALTSKYKDSVFILQDIRSQQDGMSSMSLAIRHGVNAIVHPNGINAANEPLHEPADHVLFHHPHLGTENCSLHQRFLAHLFYSVDNHWMKQKGGIFHLTLVEGQFERWKCKEQAKRHGLKLLQKARFAPPPVTTSNKTGVSTGNRYHYRRHQTGKSFASRRPNSRSFTYTFGRTIDNGIFIATTLPWHMPCSSDSWAEKTPEIEQLTSAVPKSPMLLCPFCDKEFSEKRSLKCHLRDKHSCDKATIEQAIKGGEQPRKKRRKEMISTTIKELETTSFSCIQCLPHRIFQSEKALQSHIRAKHSGIYTYIAPDWSIDKTKQCQRVDNGHPSDELQQENGSTEAEECRICGFQLVDGSFSRHFEDFVPVDESQTFACDFCSKLFREERSKLQHMNFCSKRSII